MVSVSWTVTREMRPATSMPISPMICSAMTPDGTTDCQENSWCRVRPSAVRISSMSVPGSSCRIVSSSTRVRSDRARVGSDRPDCQ